MVPNFIRKVLLTSLLFLQYRECFLGPITITTQGLLVGLYLKSANNLTFSSFTGIPFALPPVGNRRFEPPEAPLPWFGIYDATQFHPVCTQRMISFGGPEVVLGQEDCLYLNVYTPRTHFFSLNHLLPVLFFIHGGAFVQGEANRYLFDPSILMDRNVVVVTTNYRLGPHGFISTGNCVVPGNMGLKDQAAALKWVKHNIIAFGGDPSRIVVMGQSAGAASAQLHMVSPKSRNFISGVISLSGTAFSRFTLDRTNQTLNNTIKLAESFNCPVSSSTEMIACLKTIDALELARRQSIFVEWNVDPIVPLLPVIEGNCSKAFLIETPEATFISGKAAKVPIVTGITTDDGAAKAAPVFGLNLVSQFNDEYMELAPLTFLYRETSTNDDYISQQIKQYYFNNTNIDYSSVSRAALTNAYTDSHFLTSANKAALMQLQFNDKPAYYCMFGYRSSVTYCDFYGDSSYNYGACHGDDLLYVFQSPALFPTFAPNATDIHLQNIMSTMLANFAATGNPSISSLPTWEPVSSGNIAYLLIKNDTDISMQTGPYADRAAFWDSLPLDV